MQQSEPHWLQRRSHERRLWPAHQPGDAGLRIWRAPRVPIGREIRLLGLRYRAEACFLRCFDIGHNDHKETVEWVLSVGSDVPASLRHSATPGASCTGPADSIVGWKKVLTRDASVLCSLCRITGKYTTKPRRPCEHFNPCSFAAERLCAPPTRPGCVRVTAMGQTGLPTITYVHVVKNS